MRARSSSPEIVRNCAISLRHRCTAGILCCLTRDAISKRRDAVAGIGRDGVSDHYRERTTTMAATTLPPADPENLVLARLREIRDTLGNVRDEQDEQRARLSAIEHTLAQE